MTTFSTAEVESLTALLDKNFGFQRPETQRIGYSNSADEGVANAAVPAAEDGAAKPSPAGVHIPSTVVDRTIGLPAPSLSKEARAIQQAQSALEKPVKPKGNAIWAAEEVAQLGPKGSAAKTTTPAASASNPGGKTEPEHEVLYKQIMSAEDAYLGMDFSRDGSSGLSDGVVVKIKLPKAESAKDFVLDVQAFTLVLETRDYFLKAHLPCKVVEKKASAKWDVAKKVLSVSLTSDLSEKEVKMVV